MRLCRTLSNSFDLNFKSNRPTNAPISDCCLSGCFSNHLERARESECTAGVLDLLGARRSHCSRPEQQADLLAAKLAYSPVILLAVLYSPSLSLSHHRTTGTRKTKANQRETFMGHNVREWHCPDDCGSRECCSMNALHKSFRRMFLKL